MKVKEGSFSPAGQMGEFFFKYRDYTPLPLIFILFLVSDPNFFILSFAFILITLGEFLRLYSVSYIGSKSRTRGHGTGDKLITNGPYSFTRNPLYLANFMIFMGFCFFSGKPWFLVLAGTLFFVQYHSIIQFEEEILKEKFGSEYETYCDKVPQLFPKYLPHLEDLKMPQDFFLSFYTEKRTLLAIGVIWFLLLLFS